MKNNTGKLLIIFAMLGIFCSFQGPVFSSVSIMGYKQSDSYIITSDTLASENSDGASAFYGLSSILMDRDLGEYSSSSYNIMQGFLHLESVLSSMSVNSVSPNWGYNTGVLSVSVAGSNFLGGASVSLKQSGQSDITASGVVVSSASNILCSFDLTGKTTGVWDVVVTNIDGTSGTLTGGFTIKTLATAGLLYNSPNPFNPANGPTTIVYTLDSDTGTSMLLFNISGELILKENYSSGANGGRVGDNSVTWNGTSAFGEFMPNGLYFCYIIDRASEKTLAKGKIVISR